MLFESGSRLPAIDSDVQRNGWDANCYQEVHWSNFEPVSSAVHSDARRDCVGGEDEFYTAPVRDHRAYSETGCQRVGYGHQGEATSDWHRVF
jgi:hypothetical protein